MVIVLTNGTVLTANARAEMSEFVNEVMKHDLAGEIETISPDSLDALCSFADAYHAAIMQHEAETAEKSAASR